MAKYDFILFILIFFSVRTYSQVNNYHFEHIKTEDGLASNMINCFYEDSLGFMWIGTDNGLTRFDGSTFKTFKVHGGSGGIIHNNIKTIEPDINSANFWIGTSRGLCYFDIKTYKASPLSENIDSAGISLNIAVEDLAYDNNGTLWIITRNNVFKCDTTISKITNFEQVYRYNKNLIFSSIVITKNNEVFVGGSKGLYKYNNSTNKLELLEHININRPKKLMIDSEDDLWIATYENGIYIFEESDLNQKPIRFTKENGKLINNLTFDIIEFKPGLFYIINKEGGVTIFNKKTNEYEYIKPSIYDKYGLNSTALISLGKDSKNNLWVGTFNNGVNFIDSKRKKIGHFYQNIENKGLFNDNVRSLFEDSKGYIWIGTKEDGGLSRFDPKTGFFKHYKVDKTNPNALQGDIVTAICEIDERYLLVGTFLDGLHVLDRKTDRFTQFKGDTNNPNSLFDNYVTAIKQHSNGKFLIGHGQGVDLFDFKTGNFKHFFTEKSGRCIYVEDQDSIWIGTLRGLYLLDKNGVKIREYNSTNHRQKKPYPLRVNNVMAIDKNQKGIIWVASGYDGIHKLANDRSEFTKYKYAGNHQKNKVVGMLIDDHDNIWFSSKDGISKFTDSTKTFHHFNKFDGLQSNQFETHCALKTSNGYMIFGGRNGFNIFHPDSIKLNKTPPEVVITEFEIFDKDVAIGGINSPLKKHISQTRKIVLDYKQSMLTFKYVAINYSSPLKNKYAYMMEGVDKTWRFVGNTRTATYTNMREGDYVFKVKASNNDGVWNEKGAILNITILPPWWRTTWFRLLIIFSFSSIVFLAYYLRIKQLTKQQVLLKIKVKERTTELANKNKLLEKQTHDLNSANSELSKLNATKDKFFSIIAHDLRNPFSSIMGLSDVLKNDYHNISEEQRLEIINGIDTSSNRLFTLLENLLNWARSQRKVIEIKKQKISLHNEIDAIKNLFSNSLEEKRLKMIVDIPKDLEIDSDPNLFEAIFRNLLSNSIKFSHDGKIEVYSEELTDTVKIIVRDCGIGMPKETINKLFKNEFMASTHGTKGETGTGIGLVICREFIALLGGNLTVKSELGVGSSFIVVLPKD